MRRGMLSEAVYRSDFLQETAPMPQGSRVIPGALPEVFFFFFYYQMPVGRDGETGEQGLEKKDCICQPPPSVPHSYQCHGLGLRPSTGNNTVTVSAVLTLSSTPPRTRCGFMRAQNW